MLVVVLEARSMCTQLLLLTAITSPCTIATFPRLITEPYLNVMQICACIVAITLIVRDLSRDHVRPISRGGADLWNNVVTACKRCNNHKAGQTPEEANMQLLAIPFSPTHAEYIYLQSRRVLADQMKFLLAHFPRTSPLHKRLSKLT